MQYVILIGSEELTLASVKSIEHYGCTHCYDVPEIGERYCVDYGEDHIFYDFAESIVNDFDKEDLEKIPFKKPHFITMVYTSEERVKKVIQQNNFLRGIYVDNGYGRLLPIEEFIRLGMPMNAR